MMPPGYKLNPQHRAFSIQDHAFSNLIEVVQTPRKHYLEKEMTSNNFYRQQLQDLEKMLNATTNNTSTSTASYEMLEQYPLTATAGKSQLSSLKSQSKKKKKKKKR